MTMETSQEVFLMNDDRRGMPATDDATRGKKRIHDTAESCSSRRSKTPRPPITTTGSQERSGRLSGVPAVTVPRSWDRGSPGNDTTASPQYPTQTYAQLVVEILSSHPEGLQVHAIISSVKERFPGYVGQERKLRSGISGALSTKSQGDSPTFVKTTRPGRTGHPGAIWLLAKGLGNSTTAAPHARSSSTGTREGFTTITETHDSISTVTATLPVKGPAGTTDGKSGTSDSHVIDESVPVRAWRSLNQHLPTDGLAADNLAETGSPSSNMSPSSYNSGNAASVGAVVPGLPVGDEQCSRDMVEDALMRSSPQRDVIRVSENHQKPPDVQPFPPDAVCETSARSFEQQTRPERQPDPQLSASGEIAILSTSRASSAGAAEDNNANSILGEAISERRTDMSFSMVALADLYAWVDRLGAVSDEAKGLLAMHGFKDRGDHAAELLDWATLFEAAKHDAGLDGPRLRQEAEISDVHQSLETLSRGKAMMTQMDLSISTMSNIRTHMMTGMERLQAVVEDLHRKEDVIERDRQQTAVDLQSVQQDLVKYIIDP